VEGFDYCLGVVVISIVTAIIDVYGIAKCDDSSSGGDWLEEAMGVMPVYSAAYGYTPVGI